jgi:hypothetical protein
MGTQTINSSTYFSNNGNPKHRSLCHLCQLAFEENCFEDFDLQIFSTLPDLDFLDLDVMTDLCSETTGRVILVVLEEHPLLTPEVEETKTV